MKIRFTVGYVGRETAMKAYVKDDEADLSLDQALELIRLGVAEAVVEEAPAPAKKVKYGKNTQ